jgi:gamma-glutamyl-gamma-aminobutyrate hydrolase PuuD
VTPLIGITAYGEETVYGVWQHEAVLLPRTYPDSVIAAGGLPVLLPPRVEAAAVVDRLDAVVLAGGPDIDPAHYGAAPDPRTGVPRTERDAAELAVLRRALELAAEGGAAQQPDGEAGSPHFRCSVACTS